MTDLDVAVEAAAAGAAVVMSGFGAAPGLRFKGDTDPVTEVDEAAEAAVLEVLAAARPADRVLSEERGGGPAHGPGRVWIVDPLDGTVNFVHGIPQVSVSVALWDDRAPRVGVVHDAIHGEVFTAVAGGGAALDGAPMAVTAEGRLDRALVGTGFPYDRREHAAGYAHTVGAVLARAQGVRRMGSAALDFAWVAAGRLGGYWEYGLKPWDSAAGVLLVTEAGGVVTGLDGEAFRLDSPGVVAAAPGLHRALLTVVAANLPDHLR